MTILLAATAKPIVQLYQSGVQVHLKPNEREAILLFPEALKSGL